MSTDLPSFPTHKWNKPFKQAGRGHFKTVYKNKQSEFVFVNLEIYKCLLKGHLFFSFCVQSKFVVLIYIS